MKWNLTLVLSVLVALVSYGLYQLSYEVQRLGSDLRQLNVSIEKNKETIQVLKAEWAYENRPDVLQALAAKHLPLLLVAPYQVVDLGELPARSASLLASEMLVIPLPRTKPRRNKQRSVVPAKSLQLVTYTKASQVGGIER